MNTWNAGQILSVVRTVNKMDIDYLGSDSTSQNQTLLQFMNVALWNLARLCYNAETSDTIAISADGNASFTRGNAAITNMFEPLRLIKVNVDGSEEEAPQRYLDTSAVGWYCEGPNQPIHIRGLSGSFKLKYLRYPRIVTQESDPVDMPESGYKPLIMEISALVKNVKNFYEEANAMEGAARSGYAEIVQAAISARGAAPGGSPPSFADVPKAKGDG
ncbi:hypothetical protein GXP70_18095 [Paenibacillus lycopersici]|uniref:Uncharacterized protein n=1 Tax=Paenibacillus lycopersici TaxID=2704462 RepID=A0A6C0FX49_9BACL|nr:hypothetical protein [Paenibacillus lycopersici]QHT61696.1 hypothetical protein GXP70_18095 [Paenibacillus lycopersici]